MISSPIGAVALRVADIDAMTRFYETTIGLQYLRDDSNARILGVDDTDLIALMPAPDASPAPNTTGLYHFAIRVPHRHTLAQVLYHFSQTRTRLQGMSDHIVSEAIYLADPEGNGIEVYWDRPRPMWFDEAGQMQLATLALNTRDLLAELQQASTDWQGLPDGTDMGHIHLHVADIARAREFYENELGMQTMFDVGSAAFLSYDGYHHHVGINIWNGTTPPSPDALGLDHFILKRDLPDLPPTIIDPDTHHIHLDVS